MGARCAPERFSGAGLGLGVFQAGAERVETMPHETEAGFMAFSDQRDSGMVRALPAKTAHKRIRALISAVPAAVRADGAPEREVAHRQMRKPTIRCQTVNVTQRQEDEPNVRVWEQAKGGGRGEERKRAASSPFSARENMQANMAALGIVLYQPHTNIGTNS